VGSREDGLPLLHYVRDQHDLHDGPRCNRTNEKIDLNAQADLDLMTHLLHADVLVSNETGFLKHAFGQIWLPQGKVLFTSEQFAAHISKMV